MLNSPKDIKELVQLKKFRVRVLPNSKQNSVEFLEDFVKIKLKEKPIEGRANKALVEYLSNILSIPKSKIEILNGDKSSIKTIKLDI